MVEGTPPRKHDVAVIGAVGLAQLIAWGSLYYAIAVMADTMRRELGVSSPEVFAAFAASVALSGALAPWAGRLVDRRGGRIVLFVGPLIGALGFAVLANTRSIGSALFVIALHGAAMALSLYETCFAALSQHYPNDYRRAVTFVTLLGGLASSMFWPATHHLLSNAGWRLTCWIYALLLVAAALLNAAALSSPAMGKREHVGLDQGHAPLPARARGLIAAFAGASFVGAALAAHLPATLTALHFESAHAVWIAAVVGLMQVAGRALELAAGRRLSATRLGMLTFAGVFASLILLIASDGYAVLALAFALVYGAANGVMTIVGATLPGELFGTRQLGLVLGRFAAPSRVTRAIAPLAFSAVAAPFGSWSALLCTAGVAAASLAIYALAVRAR